jgi:hypothetical protein
MIEISNMTPRKWPGTTRRNLHFSNNFVLVVFLRSLPLTEQLILVCRNADM